MAPPTTFQTNYLDWKFLDKMAETGRRQLRPGESRVGLRNVQHAAYSTLRPGESHGPRFTAKSIKYANDQLIREKVVQNGHPILVAAIEYLQSLSPDRPEEDVLKCFSWLLEYPHTTNSGPTKRWHAGKHLGRMAIKECQDAAAALKHVFESTEVGALYKEELIAAFAAHRFRQGDSNWNSIGLHARCLSLSRVLLETMLKPMRNPLQTGMEYVRKSGQPLKVVDTRPLPERLRPGQDITSLTALNPALADKVIHPFIKLAHSFLVRSLQEKRDDLFQEEENEAPVEGIPQLLTAPQKRDKRYKTLILEHDSLESAGWQMFSDMYGFTKDGEYKGNHQLCGHAEEATDTDRNSGTYGLDPLVLQAVFKSYPIIFGEEIVSDAEYDQKVVERREEGREYYISQDIEEWNAKNARKYAVSLHHKDYTNARQKIIRQDQRIVSLLKGSLMYDQRVKSGVGGINFAEMDNDGYIQLCRQILSLQDIGYSNIVVNLNSKIRVREQDYTPHALLCEQDDLVLVYVGITSKTDGSRAGEYVRQKYGYPSKIAMIADGWVILQNVVQFPEPDFFCRRYTTGWTERLLQLYIQTMGRQVEVQWSEPEPLPLFGENRSNLADNGINSLYLCIKCPLDKAKVSPNLSVVAVAAVKPVEMEIEMEIRKPAAVEMVIRKPAAVEIRKPAAVEIRKPAAVEIPAVEIRKPPVEIQWRSANQQQTATREPLRSLKQNTLGNYFEKTAKKPKISRWWICDFCKVPFATYEKAWDHEAGCSLNQS